MISGSIPREGSSFLKQPLSATCYRRQIVSWPWIHRPLTTITAWLGHVGRPVKITGFDVEVLRAVEEGVTTAHPGMVLDVFSLRQAPHDPHREGTRLSTSNVASALA